MKLKRNLLPVMILLIVITGCAGLKNQTPQYKAAIGLNDFAASLEGVQNLEISMNQTGVIDPALHQTFQKAFLEAAQNGKLADQAVNAGDFKSAASFFKSALTVLQGLQAPMIGIKNPTSVQEFNAALTVAINIAQTWANQLAAQPAAGATK